MALKSAVLGLMIHEPVFPYLVHHPATKEIWLRVTRNNAVCLSGGTTTSRPGLSVSLDGLSTYEVLRDPVTITFTP